MGGIRTTITWYHQSANVSDYRVGWCRSPVVGEALVRVVCDVLDDRVHEALSASYVYPVVDGFSWVRTDSTSVRMDPDNIIIA